MKALTKVFRKININRHLFFLFEHLDKSVGISYICIRKFCQWLADKKAKTRDYPDFSFLSKEGIG